MIKKLFTTTGKFSFAITLMLALLIAGNGLMAQTNPAAFDLSTGDFSFTGFANGTTVIYPAAMQGVKFPGERTTVNLTAVADGDRVLANNASGIATGSIRNEVTNGISLLNSGSNNIGALVVAINTIGRTDVLVSFTAQQTTSGGSGGPDRISGLRLQYRVGVSGSFTDVAGTEYLGNNLLTQNAAQNFTDIALPPACENESVVQLRWVYYVSSGTANGRDRIRLDDITVASTAAVASDNVLAGYASQLSSPIVKGAINQPLAGFTFNPAATTNFTGVTVTGAVATPVDISNVRIFRDNNDNGIVDGADATVSGAGITFGTTMNFAIAGEISISAVRSYLIVGDIAFAAPSSSVEVSIAAAAFTTSSGTNAGSMDPVARALVAPPGTSTITAGAGAEPANISSLINSQGAAVINLDFTIQDDGLTPSTDFVNTKINQLAFIQGIGNDVTAWTLAIAGAELSDGANTQTGAITDDAITFSGINSSTLGLITDNNAKTYTLKIWLKADLTTLKTTADGLNLVFRLISANIIADPTGSQLAAGQDQHSGAGNNAISVSATALAYLQQPSNTFKNVATAPAITIAAIDANGNRDLDFTGSLTLSSTGVLSGSATTTVAAVSGVASFNNIIHTTAQLGVTLTAERSTPDLDWDVASTTFDIESSTIAYTVQGSSYTQDFDGLPSAPGNITWTNGSTPLPGWYAIAPLTTPTQLLGGQTGSSTTAGIGNFGGAANSNRSLGWIYGNGIGIAGSLASIGMGIDNETGNTLTEFTLSYRGRQWRTNTTTPGSLVVEYKIGGSFDNSGSGWTSTAAGLTFTGPNITGATAIDGYVVGNTAALTETVSGITWPAGTTIWIRWRDTNDPGTDAQLAIDEVNFSTPLAANTELAAYASQLSSNVVKGNNNVPLAGFTVTASTSLFFNGVTVTGSAATPTDITNLRIFSDENGNGSIDGADASISGAGISFGPSMGFSFLEGLDEMTPRSFLIVADLKFNGTSPSVSVSIAPEAFATSLGTVSGDMGLVTRIIETPLGSSTITAGPGVEPAAISALINTQGAATQNFDFTITDDGATPATDVEVTEINSFNLTAGVGNDIADWTSVIAGAELSDGTNTASGTISAGSIFFNVNSFPLGASIIEDNASQTYTVKVWLKSDFGALKTTVDGANLVFNLEPADIDFAGSQFTSGQQVSSGTDNNAISVTASALAFLQNATSSGSGSPMAPAVTIAANDVNGNLDLDFTEQIRITSTGTLSGGAVDVAAVAGVATFSTLTHTTGGTALRLTAERTNTLDWDIASDLFDITVITSATDFYRSNIAIGNWNVPASWESSPDGIAWIASTLVPGNAANTITIRNGHSITISSVTNADQIVIENGGTLIQSAAFTVNNGAGDDITVEDGGTMIYRLANTTPVYSSSTIRINTGGVLSLQASGITAAASVIHGASHIYENASVLEWGLASTPSSSGVTFFPNATAEIVPILRFVTGTNLALGGANPTVVNGVFETTAPGLTITFNGAGTKTLRNGIRNSGNIIQGATGGQFIINGATADIGGAGTITLAAAGMIINSGTAAVLLNDKTLAGTGATTLNGVFNLNGFTLTTGGIAGTGTLTGSATTDLVINGNSTLRFTSGAQMLKNLSINSGITTLASALDITAGAIANTFGTITVASGATLATAGNLTLKSNQFGAARVAAGSAAGSYITGDVTVERYIPNNGFRSWRLLSVPTFGAGQTIRQAWQEGAVNPTPASNNLPGFGTLITSVGVPAAAIAAGFDNVSTSAALLSFNPAGNNWLGMPSTNVTIDTKEGRFLFIRGNRGQGIAGTATNATTLRTKGNLYEGTQTSNTIPANNFGVVGNLYASAIDFTALTLNGGLNNLFYLWDAKKQQGSSLGVYQTFSSTNGFKPLISGGSYDINLGNTAIQQGQAFMVQAGATQGSVTFNESAKINSNSNLGFRPVTPAGELVKLDARLLAGAGANAVIADANVVVFDEAYANEVAAEDALKFPNAGENFGIRKGSKTLAIEGRKPISSTDTIFFNITNLRQQQYELELEPQHLDGAGLIALLEDSYLKTSTVLNLAAANRFSFSVNTLPASAAATRFRIVFTKPNPLSCCFTSISANRSSNGVKIDWKVSSEVNMREYQVERSSDGRRFVTAANIAAVGNTGAGGLYTLNDAAAPAGTVYYRVKGLSLSGTMQYTSIVKVTSGNQTPGFAVAPNPVEGSVINLLLKNQPAGKYSMKLVNMAGQVMYRSTTLHNGGSATLLLNLPVKVVSGNYQLEVIAPDDRKMIEQVLVK